MYLSRIRLDTKKRSTMTAFSNPQKFHGAIESAFTGERGRNLWRLDELGGETYMLVLSEEIPDLSEAVKQFGHDGESFETRDYDKLLERVTIGSRWQFRLTANPTICKKKSEDAPRGKVMAHITVDHQEKWLADRAENHGFSLGPDEFRVTKSRSYSFSKHGERRVTLLSVTYDGILTVTDPEKFRVSMINGIGRGKAYGNGLLTIVRAGN